MRFKPRFEKRIVTTRGPETIKLSRGKPLEIQDAFFAEADMKRLLEEYVRTARVSPPAISEAEEIVIRRRILGVIDDVISRDDPKLRIFVPEILEATLKAMESDRANGLCGP